jgi:hypothetical protein
MRRCIINRIVYRLAAAAAACEIAAISNAKHKLNKMSFQKAMRIKKIELFSKSIWNKTVTLPTTTTHDEQ